MLRSQELEAAMPGALRRRSLEPATKTVVVAAENDLLREQLERELSRDGYRVIDAEEGAEVSDYFALSARDPQRFAPPDVVVAEVVMAGVDGLELLLALRSKGDQTPFILLSPKGDERAYDAAACLDAEFVFEQPVRCDRVCDAVASLVG